MYKSYHINAFELKRAMIIAVAFQLADKTHIFELKHIGIIVISFLLFTFTRVHPAFIIVSAGLLGAIIG